MTTEVMPVQLGDAWVAVLATHVHEVRGPLAWVPLPGAPANLPGVVSWRGRAIAVLDVAAQLGVAPGLHAGDTWPRTLIAQVGATAFAVPAQGVREVHAIPAIEEAHATQVRLSRGQTTIGGQVMPVIDLALALAAVSGAEAEAR
jgi:chemotaxis signal transduction protein